jgi:hypothetical protein
MMSAYGTSLHLLRRRVMSELGAKADLSRLGVK